MVTFLLSMIFIQIPFELGYLILQNKKNSNKISIFKLVDYRKIINLKSYLLICIPSFLWLVLILVLLSSRIDSIIINKFFYWMPKFLTCGGLNSTDYSRLFLITVSFFSVVFNGILSPFVEELYFRGYLLPRIDRFGVVAPILNTTLFSIYHFFSPWQIPARIIALLPLIIGVWKKRNIKISILVHCGANTLFTIFGIVFLMIK